MVQPVFLISCLSHSSPYTHTLLSTLASGIMDTLICHTHTPPAYPSSLWISASQYYKTHGLQKDTVSTLFSHHCIANILCWIS